MAYRYGIDVSKYNGYIDWSKVKKDGKDFAMLKISLKNNTVEPSFETNFKNAKANKIGVSVYKYVYAKTKTEAKAEAEAIVKILKKRKLDYGVWLDIEDSSLRSLGTQKLYEIIAEMATILKENGYNTGIYCNLYWYNNVLNGKLLGKYYPIWLARYPKIDTGKLKESLNPKGLPGVAIWQYSSKGKVNGISTKVDLDVIYV